MGSVTAIRKAKPAPEQSGPLRPFPPAQLLDTGELGVRIAFAPAEGMKEWVEHHLLRESSPLFNPDHQHLLDADLEFLWACSSFEKQGRLVLGTAEKVAFRAGGWQKLRQEVQMATWFGRVPAYLITLAADHCAECDDTEFAALVEHELYHIAQALDEQGQPKFDKATGNPQLRMRGHDVEEFVGVVRRYGVPHEGMLRELLKAASSPPEVSYARVSAACGTCMERTG